ncbi:MurR/RpiR family transcriptional regulator [Pectinatus brassicae]|uniref:DNA-binding MurR/RpiR family transcriptional regulator n=1 Tax=Pectinatus brassicae TaxID=862415 RepID=A0A840UCR0_9FIRM|nr:MurR/RpiR family transcriptional regulator [Pectinatus brassicae]MBB5335511.1 DNA-binding MurR/RpiR family transcriptional regulator [Pectinatus brassicae]
MIIKPEQYILDQLTATEKKVINYINEHDTELSNMSIVDIAFNTFTSPATVSRAIRKCGINGFNELRYRLMRPNENKNIVSVNEIMNKSLIEAAQTIERISIKNLLDIINTIIEYKNTKIYVFSRGPTAMVAEEFCFKLELLDYNVTHTDDPKIIEQIAKNADKNNLFIIFSFNGQTKELVTAAKYIDNINAKLIVCCCSDRSILLKYATYYLIAYKSSKIAIKEFEVTSRIPLFILSRIIIDYLVEQKSCL